MATVWIPSLMRDVTGGRETVSVRGATVRQVVAELERAYPGRRARLCEGDGRAPRRPRRGSALRLARGVAGRGRLRAAGVGGERRAGGRAGARLGPGDLSGAGPTRRADRPRGRPAFPGRLPPARPGGVGD